MVHERNEEVGVSILTRSLERDHCFVIISELNGEGRRGTLANYKKSKFHSKYDD